MRSNRSRDTGPELALRSAVHRLGLRYRVNARPLPGVRRTADLVFGRARVAVFLDGCFWHGCPEHHTVAATNAEFWADKVATNRRRDRDTDRRLADAGWVVVRVWEHEDPHESAERVAVAVARRRTATSTPSCSDAVDPYDPERRLGGPYPAG
jgi:DNA mismatch endonuclease (patch repair protein)